MEYIYINCIGRKTCSKRKDFLVVARDIIDMVAGNEPIETIRSNISAHIGSDDYKLKYDLLVKMINHASYLHDDKSFRECVIDMVNKKYD